jgi:hypothetical protein
VATLLPKTASKSFARELKMILKIGRSHSTPPASACSKLRRHVLSAFAKPFLKVAGADTQQFRESGRK